MWNCFKQGFRVGLFFAFNSEQLKFYRRAVANCCGKYFGGNVLKMLKILMKHKEASNIYVISNKKFRPVGILLFRNVYF